MIQLYSQEINIDCAWDTISTKKVKIITLPTNFDCSRLKIGNPIAFIAAPEELYDVLPHELTDTLDLNKYNLFISSYPSSGCETPTINFYIYKDNSQRTFLKVNIIEFGACMILRPLIISFLVKKDDCPFLDKICFNNKKIEE